MAFYLLKQDLVKTRFLFFLLIFPLTVSGAFPKDTSRTFQEPTVQQVQEEALRHLDFHPSEGVVWKKNVRWSAALPNLQVGWRRALQDVVQLNTKSSVSIRDGDVFVGPDVNDYDQNFDQSDSFEIKATWYLNELIFNRDVIAVSAERRNWLRERNHILEEVSQAYFTRKREMSELEEKNLSPSLRERKYLSIDQAVGILDAYTRGWFSQQLNGGKP